MQWQLLFVSIAPVVGFMLFWARGEVRVGIACAIAVSAIELVYNYLSLGRIEPVSILSFALFAVFGWLAWRAEDARYFKLQPVAFELVLAAVMIHFYVARGTPLLVTFAEDYVGLHDALSAYQRGYATVYTTTLSKSLPYLMLAHAVLTGYFALKRSTWWWFNVRVFGFYMLVAVLFLVERLLGITP
ncbi:MAG TPA: septation protein IspZ [Polyangiales bacterium]|nr:septation protein IspZ [Polyangiales bacterium]